MHEHIVSPRVYIAVFVILLALTATTTAVAFVDLGRLNAVIMLTIAVTKATLVILYFMHVRYGSRLTWLVVSSGFVWLMILIAFTLSDVFTRGVFS